MTGSPHEPVAVFPDRLPGERYWSNPLHAFAMGIDMDYRVKLAAEMMRNGATMCAEEALAESCRLVELAEQRGLLRPLMSGDELPESVREQLLRETRAQAIQQSSAQRMMREEQPRLEHGSKLNDPTRRQ